MYAAYTLQQAPCSLFALVLSTNRHVYIFGFLFHSDIGSNKITGPFPLAVTKMINIQELYVEANTLFAYENGNSCHFLGTF